MHICFVDRSFPIDEKPAGGSGRYISNIVKELQIRGNTITIIVNPQKKITNNILNNFNNSINIFPYYSNTVIIWYLSKIPVLKALSKSLEYLLEGWYVFQSLNKLNQFKKIDIVEYTEGGDFWSTFYNKWPTIAHIHCSAFTILDQCDKRIDIGVRLNRILEHYFIKRSNKVIAPSKKMISIIENEMGHILKSSKVIPLPIDSSIHRLSIKKESNKKLLGIYASRLDPLKGGEVLLKSIQNLNKNTNEKVDFKFFGYYPEKNIEINNVHFSGFIDRDSLLKEMMCSDFIIVPTLFDNSPNIIYEAMAMGKLIIASNIGGIPELIQHGKTGLLFKKGDYHELSTLIMEIVENPNMVKKLSLNARESIVNLANLEKNVTMRLNLFHSLVDVN